MSKHTIHAILDLEALAGVTGGRQSSASQAEVKTLLQGTGAAVKDLVRQQATGSSSSSSSMMPMMMMMMMMRR